MPGEETHELEVPQELEEYAAAGRYSAVRPSRKDISVVEAESRKRRKNTIGLDSSTRRLKTI